MRRMIVSVAILIGAIALIVGTRYYLAGHEVPAGQPPLGELTAGSLDALRSEFNDPGEKVRVILLLSPT